MPAADLAAEEAEEDGAGGDSEALDDGEDDAVAPVGAAFGVEDCDHGWPEDGAGVVEHVDHRKRDAWGCEIAAIR